MDNKNNNKDNERLTKSLLAWKDSKTCNMDDWTVNMIRFIIWSQLSKAANIHDREDAYQYIWERLLHRITKYNNTKSNAHTYIHIVVMSSIKQYKIDSVRDRKIKRAEIYHEYHSNKITNNDLFNYDYIINYNFKEKVVGGAKGEKKNSKGKSK